MKYDLNVIKKDLHEKLSGYRYEHSLRVADVCLELATIYKVDNETAYLAGLVHDIAKEFDEQINSYYINKNKLLELNEKFPKVLHSYVGAEYLKEKYNIPSEIYNAVKIHTTASSNMSTLDKILFIADKIELGKNFDGIEEIRKLAKTNIDEAIVLYLENSINKLISLNKPIHPDSIEALKILKNN